MYRVRQEELPFVGSSPNLSGSRRETWASPCFCSAGCRARVRVRTGILTMRFSLSGKAGECGRSTAKPSKVPRETSLSSRLGRSTASKPLAIRRWYNLTFTSAPASSRRTCKSRRSRQGTTLALPHFRAAVRLILASSSAAMASSRVTLGRHSSLSTANLPRWLAAGST